MSALAGSRLTRPNAWALILTLLVVLLAPLAMQPTAAHADLCDAPAVGALCDGAGTVGGVVGDVGEALGDAAKGAKDAVVTGGKWVAGHAGPILKAAAALGITVGTWVACSKVLKAVATAGAAAATTPETMGAGTVAGGMAGAAAAGAVCKLVKKGGGLLLKVTKKAAKNGGKLANIAKLASGATALAALFYGTEHAAAWVLQNLLDLGAASAPNLDSPVLAQLRSQLDGVAGVLMVLATILALTFAGAMGRLSDIGRIISGMVSAALIGGVVGTLLLGALQMSDAVTNGALDSPHGQMALGNWKDLGDSYARASPVKDAADAAKGAAENAVGAGDEAASSGTPADDGKGPWIVRLLIAFFTAFCGALVKLEMLIRDALLYLLLAFGGLLLAGYPFPSTKHLAQRFGMTLLGIVVAKPVIVVTLLLGGAFMQSAAAGGTDDGVIVPLLQGAGLMALAGFMGWAILGWFSLHGVGAMSTVGARIRGTAGGGGGGGGGSRSGSRGGGESSTGSGSENAVHEPAADPARELARSAGDRVDGGAAQAASSGGGALGGVAGGRLAQMRAEEQQRGAGTPGDTSAAVAPPSSSTATDGQEPPVTSSAGAEHASPRTEGENAAASDHNGDAMLGAETGSPAAADVRAGSEDHAQAGLTPTGSADVDAAHDRGAGQAAGGQGGVGSPTPAMNALAADVPGSPGALAPSEASSSTSTGSRGDAAPGSAPSASAPGGVPVLAATAAAPLGSAPAGPPADVSPGAAAFGQAPPVNAVDAFGADAPDAAAAFGAHASSVQELLHNNASAERAFGRS